MEKLLIFIPAYNCEKQVPRVLSQLLDPHVLPWVGECIVVNNRSTAMNVLANTDGYAAAHGYQHLVVLHGDDQGAVADLLPILNDGTYKNYDCCLGSRFMKGSRIKGYSALRVVGNYGFNALFSLVAGKRITDLGSGLNLYAVEPLKTEYYKKFPDTLYFNDCMILALCQLKQRVLFFPISWREEDQVSNNKLTSFGISLLKLCGRYLAGKQKFVTREWREKPIENYTSSVIASNL